MRGAALALVTLALAGCGEPPEPVSIEVYFESPPGQPADGERQASGTCSTRALYESHVQPVRGTATVTVTDADGRERVYTYDARKDDKEVLDRAAGTWTVHVRWSGFEGVLHAGILC